MQLQAERDALELRASTSATKLEAATRELDQTKTDLSSKLKQQQNEFRALEEEQYGDWEKRVRHSSLHTRRTCLLMLQYYAVTLLQITNMWR